MKKLSIFIFFIFLFLFLFPKTVQANVLLWDDFNDGDANDGAPIDWEEHIESQGQGAWWVEDGEYVGTIVKECGPDIPTLTLAGEDSWDNYKFEVKLKGDEGIDRLVLFRYQSVDQTYAVKMISTWPRYGDSVILLKNNLIYGVRYASFINKQGLWYKLSIAAQGPNIKIYIDDSIDPIIDYTDEVNPNMTGKIGLLVWPGYYAACWGRTTTRFDDVLVTSLEPTPSPTPTPAPLQPLILLLGLGGSWNHEEIFFGIDQPQSAWYKTPFVSVYDGLIQTLQNAGYALGENLFVFYYDWLQPIDQSATDLKNYVDTVVNPPSETKVDLIGHSLGGLVSRTYIQNNPGSHGVDQLITVGSPHKGAPQVYKAWEGADLHGLLSDKERIGAGMLLRWRGFGYPNLVQAIRDLVPSVGNLLFINDYLRWNATGIIKPESSMSQQNTWLKSLGISPELLSLANTIVGTEIDTPRWLKIVERTQIDETLGRWEDGKPVGKESAPGDRTVLEESAKLSGANIITLPGLDHGELVTSTTGQEKILELLGLSSVEIVEQPEFPFEPALVFTVASPATLRVTDPLGRQIGAGIDPSEIPNATFWATEKIIIIPQAMNGQYRVEVISENGGGQYQLLIGQLTEEQDLWITFQGEVTPTQPDTYTLPFDSTLQTTDIYLANLINSKLQNILRQIRRQDINFRAKTRLIAKVSRILVRTKPLPLLLEFKRDRLAARYTQRAILETTKAIDYAEKFNPDSLLSLREILDLLDQLYHLLES